MALRLPALSRRYCDTGKDAQRSRAAAAQEHWRAVPLLPLTANHTRMNG